MSVLNPNLGFTCVTCRLVFANSGLQKEHYTSEWHRYNAKRQVTGLPPIAEHIFASKSEAYRESGNAAQKSPAQDKVYCKECRKLFQSKNAYDNHLNSSKHKSNVEKYQPMNELDALTGESEQNLVEKDVLSESGSEESEWETVKSGESEEDYDEADAIPITNCLFCANSSHSIEKNIAHMYESHGFFVPDLNYCTDIPGLIHYLGSKVGCGRFCIRCPNRRFADVGSCQAHMRDKCHVVFSIEGSDIMEYLDFYDYGELLKDEEEMNLDNVALDTGYTLVLPSGAQLGHRALMRYYKQRLRSPEDQQRIEKARAITNAQKVEMRALGWTGATGTAAVQRAKDFKYMKAIAKKSDLRQALRSNKLFKSSGRNDQM